jgi:hypothetical protein
MSVEYSKSSPYFTTGYNGNYLDVLSIRNFPAFADDIKFKINQTYQHRPDLLAGDLYGDSGLWWVFAVRNPNTIKDPIYDMRSGVTIYLPKKDTLTATLK